MPLAGGVEKCAGERSDVKMDKDRPSSWREGGGSDGGRGTTVANTGEAGRDALPVAGFAVSWSSSMISQADGASRRMRLLKKPENLLEDLTCERRHRSDTFEWL